MCCVFSDDGYVCAHVVKKKYSSNKACQTTGRIVVVFLGGVGSYYLETPHNYLL